MADDATILSVLTGLLRTDLTARIGEMVTRREHEAETQRVPAEVVPL